ncbi:MAG: DegV family protein [Clostridia bacterium]|nr:DegV family protein [Clostridia bacterium]
MAIRIMTDSAADIPENWAKEHGVAIFPLHIRFGEEEYLDAKTLSHDDFYRKLEESRQVPKTSQITPFEYGEAFGEAVQAGDQVLCFCLSSGVSGSYESACSAAAEFGDDVRVVDSRQFCVSQYIIVARAVQMRDAGRDLDAVDAGIRKELGHAHVIAIFDTLEYLRRGGRIPAVAAFAGTLLSIKPVLTIENGVVKILGKAKGMRRAYSLMTEFIRKTGIDFSRPLCLAYSGLSEERLRSYLEEADFLKDKLHEIPVFSVGATIGTYAGPDAIALAFFDAD